jgi:hypothetical protein
MRKSVHERTALRPDREEQIDMSRSIANSLKSGRRKTVVLGSALFLMVFAQGCSSMHEAIWNKAETTFNGHRLVIRPCRDSHTSTQMDAITDRSYIFTCGKRVKIEIRNEELAVNGKSYGMLGRGDSVEVKHDKVFINQKEAGTIAMK